ncbi:hypothetical protein [Xenorhabdus ehlersii]|uniref:Uncharacterized protein n=1 Tax=Xenorhabdus ehlersii TaxID=290111 RepID=A0A2D0IMD6_9GAMM|nr:hypothetical protein [Xenorhabdus ehlersii]PHM22976.1 hypothetical protein Xehl_03210 [Xenorhabdus ehlersii]RKE92644.1 hypothetical protein BDE27_0300 [Xenorhabdus ehlersii]
MKNEFIITITLSESDDGEIKTQFKSLLEGGKPSIAFAALALTMKKQIENELAAKVAIASDMADLAEKINDCVCQEDEDDWEDK